MVDDVKKTPEEELLASAKTSGTEKDKSGDDELTPEQQLIAELKGKLTESERRASEAEISRDSERAQKDTARKEAMTASEKQVIAQEDALKNSLSAAKSKFDSSRKDWRDARDSGDSQKEEDALIKMNDAQMELRSAEFQEANFKKWKEGNEKSRSTADEGMSVIKTATGDSIKIPQRSADWIRKTIPNFATSRECAEEVYAADAKAKARGIEVYSDAYHNFIKDHLDKNHIDYDGSGANKREVDPPEKEDEPVKKPTKNSSSTAAPAGGATGSTNTTSRKNTITLTGEQREAAAFTFPELHKKDPKAAEEKYAKYQMEIKEKKARGEL